MNVRVAISPIHRSNDLTRSEAEREAVGVALGRLFPDGGMTVGHRSDGSPFIPGSGMCISISHSLTYVAVAVASGCVGIDIEQPRQQLEKVAPRFLSDREQIVAESMPLGLLRAWTAKEAVFKAIRGQGVDFARDITLSDDFSSACFRDGLTIFLHVFPGVADDNMLTVATTTAAEITFL